jgi:hypothetical protein
LRAELCFCDAITAESGNQPRRLAFDTDDATIDQP